MKILVFSDSHKVIQPMRDAIRLHNPDYVIHLGDHAADAETLRQEFPLLPIVGVPGNCDIPSAPLQHKANYDGVLILMSHGHIWNVKHNYLPAVLAGRQAGANVVLFGHTHIPFCEQMEDGMWVMNPGSIRDGSYYGILTPGNAPLCRLERL